MANLLRELTEEERPREKLEKFGPEHLTEVELIAILLRTGRTGRSALDLAREMHEILFRQKLDTYGRLQWKDFTEIKGIGKAKAITLTAAIELGRRVLMQQAKRTGANFNNPERVANYFFPRLQQLECEKLFCCYLNVKNNLICDVEISHGGISNSIADVRMIMAEALRWRAAAMILVHNHPSGNPDPSEEDVVMTRRIAEAAEIMDVQLLDHIIIGDGIFYSFRRQGLM